MLLPCPHIADGWVRYHSPPATTRREILDAQASRLLAQSVAPRTRQTYSPGVRSYIQFAQQLRFSHLAPTVNDIVLFMTSLSASLSGKTIRVYQAAVRHHFVLNDGPVDLLRAPRILALLKGIDRDKLTSRPMPVPPSSRRAVTPNDLKAIREFLEFSHYAPQDIVREPKLKITSAVALSDGQIAAYSVGQGHHKGYVFACWTFQNRSRDLREGFFSRPNSTVRTNIFTRVVRCASDE